VEYEFTDKDGSKKMKIDFILCDDKGDTTFLKVQIFTICNGECPASKINFGSGISWTGACVAYNMQDSWGRSRMSEQCQLPQNSHRNLHSPFALFGLGRSPNFVDKVDFSSPQYNNGASGTSNPQQYSIMQVVPNSRIIVIPPDHDGGSWQHKLYLTPSSLIIQSVIVLTSVCGILLLVIIILHFRERRQDRKERQAQTHRFHFDAM